VAWRTEGSVERLTVMPTGEPNIPTVAGAGTSPVEPGSPLRPRDVADVCDMVREAIATTTRLRIVGRGTWLDAGRPVHNAQRISVDALSGIVDYTPGDLTLTARAGTTLDEIAKATAPHDQWLALAPWGGDRGSLGATAATATAGPMSGALGTPRDVIIGLEAVSGNGDIVRGGGRVVKNVAGFDLTRLMIGAWGTLGILTEVSVRLRGLPEREATVAFAAPNALPALADLLARLRSTAIAPLALEIVNGRLAARLGLGDQPSVAARVAGNEEAVATQIATLTESTGAQEIDGAVWQSLRTAEAPESTIVRYSSSVTRFAETWLAVDRLAKAGEGWAHGSVLRSTARVVVPHVDGAPSRPALDLLRGGARDTRVFECLPAMLWGDLAPSPVDDRLSRGVRAAFDPHRLLNPGILGEEAA
jgi:glycolate oxidase FAD binding subunit